jgi:hypothetical protein
MKNTFLKTIGTMLAILMLATFAHISVSAQDVMNEETGDGQKQENASTRSENNRKLAGSWNHTGARLNCQTGATIGTFSAMFTFTRGGTFWESGTQISPALRSPSHGVWSYESRRSYNTAFQFFRFNADGTLAGRQIVRQQIELSRDGNSYTATATAQVLDVNGNVIANNCAAGTGTRFE